MKYEWKEGEREDNKTIIERFKAKIQPKGRNQRYKYRSELRCFRQTPYSFTEFWTELKRKFNLAKKKKLHKM